MIARSSSRRRPRDNGGSPLSISERPLQMFPPEGHMGLVGRQGGLISVPKALAPLPPMVPVNDGTQKMTKLLIKVNIERSLGPVHVVVSTEKTVGDLIKAATEIYVAEKRRPLLTESDPRTFELHYSQFSLESMRPEEKLIKLRSRNFFLCSRPPASSVNCRSSDEAEKAFAYGFFAISSFTSSCWKLQGDNGYMEPRKCGIYDIVEMEHLPIIPRTKAYCFCVKNTLL